MISVAAVTPPVLPASPAVKRRPGRCLA
jgi:hypothetical protein